MKKRNSKHDAGGKTHGRTLLLTGLLTGCAQLAFIAQINLLRDAATFSGLEPHRAINHLSR